MRYRHRFVGPFRAWHQLVTGRRFHPFLWSIPYNYDSLTLSIRCTPKVKVSQINFFNWKVTMAIPGRYKHDYRLIAPTDAETIEKIWCILLLCIFCICAQYHCWSEMTAMAIPNPFLFFLLLLLLMILSLHIARYEWAKSKTRRRKEEN